MGTRFPETTTEIVCFVTQTEDPGSITDIAIAATSQGHSGIRGAIALSGSPSTPGRSPEDRRSERTAEGVNVDAPPPVDGYVDLTAHGPNGLYITPQSLPRGALLRKGGWILPLGLRLAERGEQVEYLRQL